MIYLNTIYIALMLGFLVLIALEDTIPRKYFIKHVSQSAYLLAAIIGVAFLILAAGIFRTGGGIKYQIDEMRKENVEIKQAQVDIKQSQDEIKYSQEILRNQYQQLEPLLKKNVKLLR